MHLLKAEIEPRSFFTANYCFIQNAITLEAKYEELKMGFILTRSKSLKTKTMTTIRTSGFSVPANEGFSPNERDPERSAAAFYCRRSLPFPGNWSHHKSMGGGGGRG